MSIALSVALRLITPGWLLGGAAPPGVPTAADFSVTNNSQLVPLLF
jgi:hypothetical protein